MTPGSEDVLRFLGEFAQPEHRLDAAKRMATALGGVELLVFAADPELGVLLPSPGLPQTLKGAAEWHTFVSRCRESNSSLHGELPGSDGVVRPAQGRAAGSEVVLVLLGSHAPGADLTQLLLSAPLLGALFRSERHSRALEVRGSAADEAVRQARQLTEALQRSHAALRAAYAETERAKQDAEALGEELGAQAAELEEQAAALEELNEELALSEARLRGLLDSSLDAIVSIDIASRITGWNAPAEGMFGWSEEEALGASLPEMIIPPQHREAHLHGMKRFLSTGEGPILNRRIEITALDRTGREFPVELTVSPYGEGRSRYFSAFIRDITERRDAERRLSAEQEAIRVLAESHSIEDAAAPFLGAIGTPFGWQVGALWVLPERGDRLRCAGVWTQPGFRPLRFLSSTEDQTFGRGEGLPGRVWETGSPTWVSDVTTDPNFPRATSAAWEGLHAAFAFPILAGNTLLGVAEFFSTEISRPDDPLLAMAATVGANLGQSILRIQAEERRDRLVSDLSALNERLQQMNVDLLTKSRDAERSRREADEANLAKSQFLATMSHELRTPINAVIGYAQLLEDGVVGPVTDLQRDHLARIATSSRHLLMLITDVLDLAKIEAGRIEVSVRPGSMSDVVEEALSLVRPQAAAAGLVMKGPESAEEHPYIGDPDRTRQILVNLLTNAIKFTEPGGSVSVTITEQARAPGDTRLSGEGPWTRVEVEDSGLGISPEDLDRIFEPFEQVHSGNTRTQEGTGLGLPISSHLARLMGGDLTVRSQPGRGSCFAMWLPRG